MYYFYSLDTAWFQKISIPLPQKIIGNSEGNTLGCHLFCVKSLLRLQTDQELILEA